ncbi:hypothetical protein Tco_1433495 [Tanacetum coccineum]
MTEYSQKWHNGTSSRTRSTETSDGLAAIQAQLNNLRREIKKVNGKVYAAQVGCELCKGLHYTKDCPQKEEGKILEEAYYTQFGAPINLEDNIEQQGHDSTNEIMETLPKRHEENSNIIKEIRASTDAAIRNQGASIKTLEIQIGQISKVMQERGFGILPSSTETNPRDQVKSISTTKADFSEIRRIGCGSYVVSGTHHGSLFSKIIPFPRRLQNFGCDDWREARDVRILDAYDHTLPQKEKDPWSFTLPCFIHNICFDKALIDLGASVSVMPFSTYTNLGLGILSHTRLTIELVDRTIKQPRGIAFSLLTTNLGLGILSHTRLTIELADRTIKQPRGIAENVLVRIGKFIFPIDFILLDIPEDNDVPLILGRPFLSTAHSKIDVFKRMITLRGFTIIDDDEMTKGVVLGMRFCKKYTSCQRIMKKFALRRTIRRPCWNYDMIYAKKDMC